MGDISKLSPIGVIYHLSPLGDSDTLLPKATMRARTPRDIGLIMRERRRVLAWGQQELASRVGVSRQWVVDVEQGKPGTEIGLVLRALSALEIDVLLESPESSAKKPRAVSEIDAAVARARGKKRG
jgi:HTH-type transcriptional regulator/antitoxin HipB